MEVAGAHHQSEESQLRLPRKLHRWSSDELRTARPPDRIEEPRGSRSAVGEVELPLRRPKASRHSARSRAAR